jgi:hypothetical protein
MPRHSLVPDGERYVNERDALRMEYLSKRGILFLAED